MDLAVHDIDIMRGIAGSEVQSVFAMGGSHANKAFEDYANILLQFKDGKVGFVEVNWLTPMKVRKMFLTCSEKYVQIDYIDQSVEISSSKIEGLDASNMFRLPIEYDVKRVSVRKDEPLKRELESFISACETGATNVATGQDAVENIKVCEAALMSLKRREPVPIPTSKTD
jgi:UDP-N-acetylglucosamine 3-dehydrogenase